MKIIKTLVAALAVSIAAMSATAYAADKGLVGVLMPTKTSQRWINDGDAVKSQLEALGYTVDLQYAQDDIPNQLSQLENEITKGPKALIIASIDGTTMSAALQKANDAGVVVVAYDRLIKKTGNVDYYTTFDNFGVGVIQANSLLKGLGYPDKKGPFNIELFGGSPDDNNAFFFYNGAMSVLQPLIDSKVLVVKSGQMGMDKVGTLRWLAATAQARMDNLLSANYSSGGARVDGVLSPYDGLSRGIIASLRAVGYGTADQPWPVVTGQDAETASVKAIIAGEQYSTVFKDTRDLAKATVELVDKVLSGGKPDGLDTKTYNNDVKVVPSILLTPHEVDKSNYQKLVVDSGYIKAADLK
ncbi:sugar ABC transporter substrate-binding protein [Mesorhizobium sp. B2-3-3]|uniref:multiple monosaccharide ABC transporter substrate-binding protein n=1 Tax=unclassified Mesorhizobium TaxID=325217 RepID=UPI00112E2173|nr:MULTISPECIES: multiple monosaccharide ABC transporter substrate-binding protein [unclassified Mesorhizobium]TPK68121.1 sugar ABC transporter substrate-binding protein [Mesorhizobium sp. B2-4-15]TPM15143.1 sugar ABC transporter substrate-binding protein [Mesorhizobium sp. B2-3-5]TPM89697.1 sugar ABC transporter substrate-binding protein [Mesorhizobium sp. B2-3-3]